MLCWLVAAALAGEAEGELALDLLHATSTSDLPSSGPEEGLSATELGMRVRGSAEQARFSFALDYQGREAVAGQFTTTPYRLFYRAEAMATVVEDRLVVGVGRFIAPSVLFLAVDGARGVWTPSDSARIELFAGRRGITSARSNLGFDTWLPAVGGSGSWRGQRASLDAMASLAGDQASYGTEGVVPGDPTLTTTDTWTAIAVTGGGTVEPVDDALVLGARGTISQGASWLIAPTASSPELVVTSVDLYQALGFARYRISDDARVDLDVISQVTAVPISLDELQDPSFTDVRGRFAGRLLDAAWLRPDVRLRLRQDRTELRTGLAADIDHLVVPGPFVRARAWFDDILMDRTGDDVAAVDRLLWSASAGWSRGGLDLEAGASFVDRAAGPVSGRSPALTTSQDLSPFVLEAQNIVFLRSFVATSSRWFGGADLEANVQSGSPEVRAFVQVGLLGDASW
ncbi:MAG: hypothetical protein H6738_00160 [Alphaproteobacteria bacterium]|nr:hypothetical protein [Alphaproteobacteria bacterium]MCB9695179.1 hypothetical protein [Alphaproteobacteria bacterium]